MEITHIPRYHVWMDVGHTHAPGSVSIGSTIVQHLDGVWCKWADVHPYIEHALEAGMAPLTHFIPDGIAHGLEEEEDIGDDRQQPLQMDEMESSPCDQPECTIGYTPPDQWSTPSTLYGEPNTRDGHSEL